MLNDARYAIRMLSKHPVSTVVIVATLSLLVGAMTWGMGIYLHEESAMIPFPQHDRLVRLWRIGGGATRPQPIFPAQVYAGLRRDLKSVDLLAAFRSSQAFVIGVRGEPLSTTGAVVSASTFDFMGIQPLLGRVFSSSEEHWGDNHLVVLTQHLWESRFDSDGSIIGTSITLNDVPYTVIGVMPESADRNMLFFGIDLWIPGDFESPGQHEMSLDIVARLKPGYSLSQLRAELDVALPAVEQTLPEGWRNFVKSAAGHSSAFELREDFGHWRADEATLVMIITILPVLIACSNLANILLGRIESRRREFALRFSIGAARFRVLRQVLVESVALALLSMPPGVIIARLVAQFSAGHGGIADFNMTILASVAAFASVLGCLIGSLPAWRATRADLANDLKDGGGSASGGIERHRLRHLLTASQMAMTTVLCISAGLLVRSYVNRRQFDPGFEVSHLVDVVVWPRHDVYDTTKRALFCDQAVQRIAAVPGVLDVGVASTSLVDLSTLFRMSFLTRQDGNAFLPGHVTHIEIISPSMHEMANIRVLRGRQLREDDRGGSEPVMLVSQSFVDSFFSKSDPLGQQIGMNVDGAMQWITIVGVVPDRRNLGMREIIGPEVYLCHHQFAPSWMQYNFIARTQANPAQLAPVLRKAVQSIDPVQPVSQPLFLSIQVQRAVARDVYAVRTMSALAGFGLLMAVLGIYGVVSRAVLERTHEVGVRMALGARRRNVLEMMVRQTMRPVAIGLVIGIAVSAGVLQALKQLLFGVGPADPPTYLAVSAVLCLTALLAALFPALSATRVDPMMALRAE